MVRLILVRHGETKWTAERRYQGHCNTPLTAQGCRHAAKAARALQAVPVDFIYSSTLGRARETAQFIKKILRRPVRHDSRLNELSFGRWEGRTAREIMRAGDRTYRAWIAGRKVSPPGGETLASFQKRTARFLREICLRHKGKTVVLVSHGGTIKMMLCRLLKLPFRYFWVFRVDPASISVVRSDGKFSECVCLNDRGHLGPKESLCRI